MRTISFLRPLVAVCLLLSAAACAAVPRQAALDLADAGQRTARAVESQNELTIDQRRAALGFNAFLNTQAYCEGAVQRAERQGRSADAVVCEPRLPSAEAQAASAALVEQLDLRERAAGALGRAYGAFRREAETDEAVGIDAALGEATASVNALGAVLGLGALPAVVTEVGRGVGVALAQDAERRRLLAGSRSLRAATGRLAEAQGLMREGVEAERRRYLTAWRQLRRTLVARNVVKADPDLAAVASAAGVGPLRDAASPRDVRAGADAFSEIQMQRDLASALAAFDASTGALRELSEQHAEYEAGRPVSPEHVAVVLEDLADRVERAREPVSTTTEGG